MARRELLISVKQTYQASKWSEKQKIIDGFVAVTNYDRKYAIHILNSKDKPINPAKPQKLKTYDIQLRQALIYVWNTANQICSKRLVPFMPQLVSAMEQHGHLRLDKDVRKRLLSISPATVDRMLSPERTRIKGGISTTKRGNLLKNQIQVRTFADWDNVVPGFIEADLVAHCGGNTNGSFLNTLTLIDISTGWLECMPLLRKSASDVIDGLNVASELMPFPLLGLDTDCGSEFINYDLLDYCEEHKITFTRARTHKKNDQAHVEEKNGSVVRRLVGYDRFQGQKAWEALAMLHRIIRKYVNFFQPSLKLVKKERLGAKVFKKYDKAKTPYQRILLSDHLNQKTKDKLTLEYQSLDPVLLLEQLEKSQTNLWKFAWNTKGTQTSDIEFIQNDLPTEIESSVESSSKTKHFYRTSQTVDLRKMPRTWRTREDPFERVWEEIKLRLELTPEKNACELIRWLIEKYPNQYKKSQTRTLQRRIAKWHNEQESQEDKLRQLMSENLISKSEHDTSFIEP